MVYPWGTRCSMFEMSFTWIESWCLHLVYLEPSWCWAARRQAKGISYNRFIQKFASNRRQRLYRLLFLLVVCHWGTNNLRKCVSSMVIYNPRHVLPGRSSLVPPEWSQLDGMGQVLSTVLNKGVPGTWRGNTFQGAATPPSTVLLDYIFVELCEGNNLYNSVNQLLAM